MDSAVDHLARTGDPRAVPLLIRLLTDADATDPARRRSGVGRCRMEGREEGHLRVEGLAVLASLTTN